MQALRSLTSAQPWRCASSIHTRRYMQTATAQAAAQSADTEPPAAEKAPKKRIKQKTLAEAAAHLPENGLGARFTRVMWLRNGYDESFWTISKVRERDDGKMCFYGRRTFRGKEESFDRRIKPVNKRDWRYVGDDSSDKPELSDEPVQ